MSFKSLLFLTLACLIYRNEASDILKVLPQAQVILQKFLNIVEANQLNVSIVTSQALHWSNGQLHQIRDSALLLLPNSVHLTQTQLTQEAGKQWVDDLHSWSSQGNGIATYREVHMTDGEVTEQLVQSSNVDQIPISPSYEYILESHEEKGLKEDSFDSEILYNYLVPGTNGQDHITNVFVVNMNITIIANSQHMKLTQINQMKDVLAKIWLSFSDNELRAEYLSIALNAQIPVSPSSWRVLIGPESFFIPSGNWVQLSIADTNVVIFALEA